MALSRRIFLQLSGAAVAAPAFAGAQDYPSRPITMIVPLAAGGISDVMARVLAERMRGPLGQPIIVENVSGADGSIGVGRVARAKADGYTIGVGGISEYVLNGALYSLQYDVLNDFAPISPISAGPFILFGRKTMPANNLDELIFWLKANPNKASAGVSVASGRLVTAFFQKETGTQFALVPYRGNSIQDLVTGQIDLSFGTTDQLPLARSGNIKAYAVTSDARLALAPDVPTFSEMGLPTIFWSLWHGLFAPKRTPRDIVNKLNAAAAEALADPVVRSRFSDLGREIFPRELQTPDALAAMQKADAQKWWPIIKEFGIKPQ